MALSGDLRELGPLELLQMIGLQRKSGVLRVEASGRRIHLHIDRAEITAAHTADLRLLPLLRAMAILDEAQVDRLRLISEDEGADLVEMILRAEAIEPEALRPGLALHAQAEVDFLLSQTDGTFEFDTASPPARSPVATGLTLERALHEGVRRLDEIANLRETTFPDGAIVEWVAGPDSVSVPGAAFLGEMLAAPRRVSDILSLPGLPAHETLVALDELSASGAVRVRTDGEAPLAPERPRGESMPLRSRLAGVARVATAVGIAVFIRAALALSLDSPHHAPLPYLPEDALERREVAQLTLALEIYRFESGNYPLTLYSLTDRKLLAPSAIEDSEGRLYPYDLRPGGTGYSLRRIVEAASTPGS
jgi:hypothetical protein